MPSGGVNGWEQRLPDGKTLQSQLNPSSGSRVTLQDLADRYGVSRQAVHKRIRKWKESQDAQR